MRWAAAWVVVLVGCVGPVGPPGPEGPPGDTGDTGDTGGAPKGRLVWKDATGAVVARDAAIYTDASGYHWTLDPETARPYALPVALYYAQLGCAGPAAVSPVQPRTPIRLEGEADFYIRPDNVNSVLTAIKSFRPTAQGACAAYTASMRVVPKADLRNARPAQEPAWPYVPPLHMERE